MQAAYWLLRLLEMVCLLAVGPGTIAAYIIAIPFLGGAVAFLFMWYSRDDPEWLISVVTWGTFGVLCICSPRLATWLITKLMIVRIRLGMRLGIAPPNVD